MENRNRRWVRLGTHRKTKQNRMEEINVNKEERVEGEKNVSQLGRRRTCRNNNFPCATELWSAGEKVDCSRLAFFERKKHVRHAWRDRFFISLFKNCNLYFFSSFIVSLRVLVCDRCFTDSATIIFVDSTVKNCKGEEGGWRWCVETKEKIAAVLSSFPSGTRPLLHCAISSLSRQCFVEIAYHTAEWFT